MQQFLSKYIDKIIGISLVILLTIFINLIINLIISNIVNRSSKKKVKTFLIFLEKIINAIVYTMGILICLSFFDIFKSFTTTLLSGLGIGSVVLGLAAQESLKDFFGSVAVVASSPFDVGDYIECPEKNISGIVEDITMRHTVIKNVNQRRIIIPNSVMNSLVIENYNFKDQELLQRVEYPISYESDVDKAINIIKEEQLKIYKLNPKGIYKNVEYPKVKISSWQDSGISLLVWVYGKDLTNLYENIWNLNYNIKKRFKDEGIEIPYPHVQIVK